MGGSNLDVIHGKADSVLCKCLECGRLQGSHECHPLELVAEEIYTPEQIAAMVGHCRICGKGICVKSW